MILCLRNEEQISIGGIGMKKCYLVAVLLICFLFTACIPAEQELLQSEPMMEDDETILKGSVYIEGVLVEGAEAILIPQEDTVRLPFLQIVKALGMTVQKIGDGKFLVQDGWSIYVLDGPSLSLVRLLDLYDTENLIIHPPGATSPYTRYESNDVIMDSVTLEVTLQSMDVNIDCDAIDYETSSVYYIMGVDLP